MSFLTLFLQISSKGMIAPPFYFRFSNQFVDVMDKSFDLKDPSWLFTNTEKKTADFGSDSLTLLTTLSPSSMQGMRPEKLAEV